MRSRLRGIHSGKVGEPVHERQPRNVAIPQSVTRHVAAVAVSDDDLARVRIVEREPAQMFAEFGGAPLALAMRVGAAPSKWVKQRGTASRRASSCWNARTRSGPLGIARKRTVDQCNDERRRKRGLRIDRPSPAVGRNGGRWANGSVAAHLVIFALQRATRRMRNRAVDTTPARSFTQASHASASWNMTPRCPFLPVRGSSPNAKSRSVSQTGLDVRLIRGVLAAEHVRLNRHARDGEGRMSTCHHRPCPILVRPLGSWARFMAGPMVETFAVACLSARHRLLA